MINTVENEELTAVDIDVSDDVEQTTVKETNMENQVTQQEKPLENSNDGFKSQREIDVAISKRLEAERRKLRQKYEKESNMAKAIKERFPDIEDASQLSEKLDGFDNPQQSVEQLAAGLLTGEVELKKMDPEFDLIENLSDNPQAMALALGGASVKQVYDFLNMDKLIASAKLQGEKTALESIRSRQNMPSVNQAGGYEGIFDVDNLTLMEIESIEKRLRRGERVKLP